MATQANNKFISIGKNTTEENDDKTSASDENISFAYIIIISETLTERHFDYNSTVNISVKFLLKVDICTNSCFHIFLQNFVQVLFF